MNAFRALSATLALASILSFHSRGHGQTAPSRYWVQFEGKLTDDLPAGYSTPYTLETPSAFLSPKAIFRRIKQNIDVTAHDLPIPPSYIDSLQTMEGFRVILKSKWFNAVTIAVVDSAFDPYTLLALPMVNAVKSVQCIQGDIREPVVLEPPRESVEPTAYGGGLVALEQLNADWLHGLGFRGDGMTIAVLDAGFENTESLPIFQRAWDEGRIQEGLDAMYSQGGLFAHHRHGTAVLGTMAGHLKDSLIGTAPDASYVLYRTEDAYSEYLIEEDYWVAAAEHADSAGVDLINTSLGYSLFDDSTMNHVYADLNGTTARISQAAEWAAEKGILCTTSAGNSGAAAWHYITAPADADGILTVGAVNANGQHAVFSGWGPTADGRVKPDVMALGVQAAYPFADSTIRRGNGTSFSSPILCGAAACLWQAFPEATAQEIRHAIAASAHLHGQPNDSMGNGIPDFRRAFGLLNDTGAASWVAQASSESLIFPNPSNDGTLRWIYHGTKIPSTWQFLDANGHLLEEGHVTTWSTAEGHLQGYIQVDAKLPNGTYIFQLTGTDAVLVSKPWILMR
ncbi:MAG: serine protease [Flavobacteriales bacterium]|nr:serine protease [Flavobacteriales bacterium]